MTTRYLLKSEGGGIIAFLPAFGEDIVYGIGDTKQEAITEMEEAYNNIMPAYVEAGWYPYPDKI
jgi:hypothetical protein